MHPSLGSLVFYAKKQALKGLRRTQEVPLFAAILDDGVPSYLNIHLHPEYDAPKSVAGLVELMRVAIRETGTSGALFCAPVRVPADDGTEWDAIQLHADHIEDDCAYLVVIRYRFVEDGELRLDKPVTGETDDRILASP
jgi:hypothetical protein